MSTYTPVITITGHIQDFLGNNATNAQMSVRLTNFGQDNPRVPGSSIITNPWIPVTIDGTGAFSFTPIGNDVIWPPTTLYLVTFTSDNANTASRTIPYQFTGTGSSDLSSIVPFNQTQSVAPPVSNVVIKNPTALQTITGFGISVPQIQDLTAPLLPHAAGGTDLGSAALPFADVYVGGAATNNIKITGSATAARTFTLPDANTNPVQPLSGATSHQWVAYIDSNGVLHTSQPSFSDISGTLAVAQLPSTFVLGTIQDVAVSPNVQIDATGPSGVLKCSAVAGGGIEFLEFGDTQARIRVRNDGTGITFSDGTNSTDTSIARVADGSSSVPGLVIATGSTFGVPKLAADPTTTGWGNTQKGRVWYNTTTNQTRVWNGSAISNLAMDFGDLASGTATGAGAFIVDTGTSIFQSGTGKIYANILEDNHASPNVQIAIGASNVFNCSATSGGGFEVTQFGDAHPRISLLAGSEPSINMGGGTSNTDIQFARGFFATGGQPYLDLIFTNVGSELGFHIWRRGDAEPRFDIGTTTTGDNTSIYMGDGTNVVDLGMTRMVDPNGGPSGNGVLTWGFWGANKVLIGLGVIDDTTIATNTAGFSSSQAGRMWYSNTTNTINYWDGGATRELITNSSHLLTNSAATNIVPVTTDGSGDLGTSIIWNGTNGSGSSEVRIGSTTNISQNSSRLYVKGGANGANVDIQADGSTPGSDIANCEVEASDYATTINSIAMRQAGPTALGTYVGITAQNVGVLDFGGSTQVAGIIRTSGNFPLVFGTNDVERYRINATGESKFSSSLAITGAVNVSQVAAPAAPTVAPHNGSASTWAYKIVAYDNNNQATTGSTAGQTTTGAATLDATHWNQITWSEVPGASLYKVFRTTVATSPTTTGVIGTVTSGSAMTLRDNGLAGDSSSVPTANTTGEVTVPALAVNSNVISVGGQSSQSGNALGVPVVVYSNVTTGISAAFAASTVFTPTSAGWYRIHGTVWPTVLSTTGWTVNLDVTSKDNGATGSAAQLLQQVAVGATYVPGNQNTGFFYCAASQAIQISLVTASGSNTSGVLSYAVTIERLG